MSWWAIEVAPGAATPDHVAQQLAALTGQAVEQRSPGLVVGFAADAAGASTAVEGLRQRFGAGLEVRVAQVPAVDWTVRWRDGMARREVGRLSVGPGWLLDPGPGRVVIDPAMAFGTGEHGSTRGAIALLDRHLSQGAAVVDIGSGSGILAIAAAQLGAARAIGVEVDPEAEPIAEDNARRNGVADRVRFVTGDAAVLLPLLGPCDVVVANTLRSINTALLPLVAAALGSRGVAVFAGMERPEREAFLASLAAAGFEAMDEVVDDGWWAVAARRP